MNLTLRDWRAIVSVLLLPVLATALTLWSMTDRAQNFDNVPAAIVNLDEGTTMVIDGKEQQVPLGRELVAGLMYPEETFDVNLKWEIVTEQTASQGLQDGDFAAILTIPKNFSKNVVSIGTKDATPALITVTSNDASSEIMGVISSQIVAAAADSMGSVLTERMLDEIYLGFNDLQDQMNTAAKGAHDLDDGAKKLGEGVLDLHMGVGELQDGSGQLANGLTQLAQGTNALQDSANQLATGMNGLSQGANALAGGMQQFRDGFVGTPHRQGLKQGIDQLNQGVNGPGGLAQGSKQLADGAVQLDDGINALVNGLQTILEPLAKLEQALPNLPTDNLPDTSGLQARIEALQKALQDSQSLLATVKAMLYGSPDYEGVLPRLQAAVANCPADQTPQYCQQLAKAVTDLEAAVSTIPDSDPQLDAALAELNRALAQLKLDELLQGIKDFQAQIQQLITMLEQAGGFEGMSDQLEALRTGSAQLREGAEQLSAGISGTPGKPGVAQGVAELSRGTSQLQQALDGNAGQSGLVPSARQLADGLAKARPGANALAGGANQLGQGAQALEGGAQQLHDGTTQLGPGTNALYEGIMELIKGTSQFATELKDGAEQVPSYTDAERTRIASMGAMPVVSEASVMYDTNFSANSSFPWAAGIVLWLGAFGTYLVMPGLRKRELASGAKPLFVAWHSFKWAAFIGLIQALGVGVIATLLGVHPNDLATTTALMVIGALSFAAINQALLAVAGARLGRVLALLFLVIQIVSLGGVIPIETAPVPFQALHTLMPLSYLTQGLMHTVIGGKLTSFLATATPLLVWGLVAFAFTIVAAGKARQIDIEQIRRRKQLAPSN